MALFDKWCPALEAALREPFPREMISFKEAKSKKSGVVTQIPFVSWTHYVKRLNELVGNGWSMSEPRFARAGSKLVVSVSLTILGVTRTNVGDENEAKDDYGTASTNAHAQAFKRACAMFEMGLNLYDKEERARAIAEQSQPRSQRRQQNRTEGAKPWTLQKIRELMEGREITEKHRAELTAKLAGSMDEPHAKQLVDWLEKKPARKAVNV